MNETKYLKCPCQKCGGSIEFPARGIGAAVNCPHCGERTTLFAQPIDEAPPDEPPTRFDASPPITAGDRRGVMRKSKLVLLALVVLAIAGLMAAGLIYKNRPLRRSTPSEDRAKPSSKASSAPVTTNLAAVQPVPSNAPAPANAPKSREDLKVGAITLEKAKGSSLVYAVGVLRNESGHQRF